MQPLLKTDRYENISINSAVKIAIAGTITTMIYMSYHLSNGYWAVLACLLTMQGTVKSNNFMQTLKISFDRLLGSIVGVLLGIAGHNIMAAIVSDGYTWLIYMVIFVMIFAGAYITEFYEGFRLLSVSSTLIILMSITHNSATNIAYIYALEVLLGVSVSIIVTLISWPIDNLINNNYKT